MKHKKQFWKVLLLLLGCSLLSKGQPLLLKEIPQESYGFASWNDKLIFFDKDSIWTSDGTTVGTQFLKDLGERGLAVAGFRGQNFSYALPSCFFFFTTNANGTAFKVWRSNGTTAGTSAIATYSKITPMKIYNNQLIFAAEVSGSKGLYKVGSTGSPVLIKTIDITMGQLSLAYEPALFINDNNFEQAGTTFYFDTPDYSLWKTDGTNAGTIKVKQMSAPLLYFRNVNGTLFFTENTYKIWKTNGTEAGTTLVRDVGGAGGNAGVDDAIVYKNKLYFIEAEENYKHALVSTDGTEAGSQVIAEDLGGYDYSINIGVVNDLIYINTNNFADDDVRPALWRSDGTNAGTFIFNRNSYVEIVSDNYAILSHSDSDESPATLMQSDLTVPNTKKISDIFPGTSIDNWNFVKNVNNTLFFTTRNYPENIIYLWKYKPGAPLTPSDYFTLVNADTDKDKTWIHEGDTVVKYPSDQISIKFNPVTNPGSVRFRLNGNIVRTETSAPYLLVGDVNGDYTPWTASAGSYTLVAEKFSGAGATGTLIGTTTLHFVLQTPTLPSPPLVNAGADKVVTLPDTITTLFASASDPGGSITSVFWEQLSGPLSPKISTPLNLTTGIIGIFQAGTYRFRVTVTDNSGLKTSDDILVNVDGPGINYFYFFDGFQITGKYAAKPFHEYNTSNILVQENPFNFIAETTPSVKSVKFQYDDVIRIENQEPYALFGDNNGVYNTKSLPQGNHIVYATPYTGLNATGTAGVTVGFRLLSQHTTRTGATLLDTEVKCFPNPSTESFQISVPVNSDTEGSVAVYNSQGILQERLFEGNVHADQTLDLTWTGSQSGIYFLKIKIGNREQMQKLVLYR